MSKIAARGNDCKSNRRESQIRDVHKQSVQSGRCRSNAQYFAKYKFIWEYRTRGAQFYVRPYVRRKMVPKIGNLGRKRVRSQAFLDRVAVEGNSDSDRSAPRRCAGRRWTWSETPLQKKKEKRRRRTERDDASRAAEKSNARTNEQASEWASRPQFHAIESTRVKLKTNRFPAPCWHALHLRGLRATWVSGKKEEGKNWPRTVQQAYENTRVISLHEWKRSSQTTIG